jgi:hypothetical protein
MFLIVWTDDGFDRMNEIIRSNPGRKREFAVALRQIARQLTADPLGVGESREDEMRVMFAGELSVFYRVDTDDNTVRIGDVRLRQL